MSIDINVPGELDRLDLAEIAHRKRPHLKIVVMSGGRNVTPADVAEHGVFIAKLYKANHLEKLIDDKLAAAY